MIIAFGTMSFADDYFEISKNIDVFSSLYKEVNTYYVDDVEPSKLMRACIDGMLKTLDPFTNYFSGSQVENAKIQQGGKFGGLGIEFEVLNGYPVITSVTQGQPADESGLQVGDIIKTIEYDGFPTVVWNYLAICYYYTGHGNSPDHPPARMVTA